MPREPGRVEELVARAAGSGTAPRRSFTHSSAFAVVFVARAPRSPWKPSSASSWRAVRCAAGVPPPRPAWLPPRARSAASACGAAARARARPADPRSTRARPRRRRAASKIGCACRKPERWSQCSCVDDEGVEVAAGLVTDVLRHLLHPLLRVLGSLEHAAVDEQMRWLVLLVRPSRSAGSSRRGPAGTCGRAAGSSVVLEPVQHREGLVLLRHPSPK